MREIESELRMRRELLIQALDEDQTDGGSNIKCEGLSELRKRFPGRVLGGPIGIQRTLKSLVRLIAGGWVVLLIKQVIYLFISWDVVSASDVLGG